MPLCGRLVERLSYALKMGKNLETFKPVFGEAKGELESAGPCALLPFLFYLHPLSTDELRIQLSDFHFNTWHLILTLDYLEELRDEVGLGGSWNDFLSYLGAAFASENVKVVLGGPASSVGGHGATSAKITSQKAKGMPRISISLEKLKGDLASDAMGNISLELFKAFKQKSEAIITEEKRVSQLIAALSEETEKVGRLQKQLDSFSFANKKKGRKNTFSQSTTSMLDTSNTLASQVDVNTLSQTQPVPVSNESQPQPQMVDKVISKGKVRAAPTSRRAKHRGVKLADDSD